MQGFTDLSNHPEDQAKADRYAAKLKKKYPELRIIDTQPGIVPGTVLLRVGQPLR